jgi:MSHA pilin protein MshC
MSTSTGKGFAMRLCKSSCRGFTLVELVAVLIITSVLALVALPRFYDPKTFDARINFDQAQSVLRYAQKIAIAQNRDVYVRLDGASIKFCFETFAAGGACSKPVPAPTGQDGSIVALGIPSGITYSAAPLDPTHQGFYFSSLGRPFNPDDIKPNSTFATLTIDLTDGGVARKIVIEQEIGHVHTLP